MGKHNLQVSDIHDSAVAEALDPVLGKVLQEQSWWMERKNTLAAIAQFVLQFTNVSLLLGGVLPLWATVVIGVLIFLAEVVVHAATKGPVTKSGAERILETARAIERGAPGVPVYHRPE